MRPVILAMAAMLAAVPPARAAGEAAPAKAAERTQSMVDTVSHVWLAAEWQSYAARFVSPEGRVIDNANGGISHSEGQGYGLLLAAKAGDAARFQAIWSWTARTLMVRKDGLAAWKWEPASASVTDTNNATDGDILIAWALADAAKRFNRPDYRKAAEAIARAVGAGAVLDGKAGPVLLPGVKGFAAGEQPDGPVVNLSYWVFPAFATLKELAPDVDWAAVRRSGLALLEGSRFGPYALPSEWESLAGPHPRPAANFAPGFGYNAIRIPLYLALEGSAEAKRALHRFAGSWAQSDKPAQLLEAKDMPVTVPVGQPGYDLVLATARCAAAGQAVPPDMIKARSTLYFPETLRLLSVIAIQERFPACL